MTRPRSLPHRLHTGTLSREKSRKLEYYRRKSEIVVRIKLALRHLGSPNVFEQVDYLFDLAHSECVPPTSNLISFQLNLTMQIATSSTYQMG